MRVNVLQHAPNEGPGSIQAWCHARDNEMFVYHPGILVFCQLLMKQIY